MLKYLVKILPESLIVDLWRTLPLPKSVRRFLVWSANTHFIVGVIGFVYSKNGDLLLVKHTYRKKPWGLPGGTLGKEHPVNGLIREVKEETGFAIKPVSVIDTIYYPKPTQMIVIIEAKLIGGAFIPSPEVSDFCFLKPSDSLDKLSELQKNLILKYREKKL